MRLSASARIERERFLRDKPQWLKSIMRVETDKRWKKMKVKTLSDDDKDKSKIIKESLRKFKNDLNKSYEFCRNNHNINYREYRTILSSIHKTYKISDTIKVIESDNKRRVEDS